MTKTPTTITAPCLGCEAPLVYTMDSGFGGAPDFYPPMGVHAYQNGHLCSDCATAVSIMLRGRAAARTPMGRAAVAYAQQRLTSDDDTEVDNDALVSPCKDSNGCHVQAWLWIDYDKVRRSPGKVASHEETLCAPCAAEENGMEPCNADHLTRGVACTVCVVKYAAGRAL